ncbi:hypothetical protein GOBAR_DD19277 [Gossypium barbadense]|nr:hypothetical protein GOBAR_DD19277 [Gossypium barbadense]
MDVLLSFLHLVPFGVRVGPQSCLVSRVWPLKLAWPCRCTGAPSADVSEDCYLVDPASSHMLVSKIKPCRYNRSNSRANTCNKPRLLEGMHLLDKRSTSALPVALMIHDNLTDRTAFVPTVHHSKFLPYQVSMVGQWPTMVVTGDGELGFDS